MGSLASRPKVPAAQPQIVYMQAPPAAPPPSSNPGSPPPPERTASEIRASSLLARDRSRFGTISTSFRGLLDLVNTTRQRKTLLGE